MKNGRKAPNQENNSKEIRPFRRFLHERFRLCAQCTARAAGAPLTFVVALLLLLLWAASGPLFHFSDTWQLVINTATTIITFLMVFLIQNTQNRDTRAIQLKLDELLRVVAGARPGLVDLEDLSDEQLDLLQGQFKKIQQHRGPIVPPAKPSQSDAKREQ